ncbi:diaminobutyrate--2-oxoglutarate transaminase [Streptomyces ferrugineus]|uniref:diaminobutyrate--2-oxoglutarate transaminase n=1 Tax=Streptomyces ferrugineus TaxID=1413221 RepID=UPI00223F5B73|nr:diaminobutyrate--2-oxoglutarate transaminase [Streptomyces ferrugineus]
MVFTRAKGPHLFTEDGRRILDFFSGAGALNYGHNDEAMTEALVSHLRSGGVLHGLDLYTATKRDLLHTIQDCLLTPRGWDYKVQFCGPTGADASEAAIKLARKVTGRRGILAFNGSYHGMTAGALAVSGARRLRAYGSPGANAETTFVPYENSMYGPFDSLAHLDRLVEEAGSAFELPAAVIVESVQIQAGVFAASAEWLRGVREWTERHGVLLICDEVQSGCGRAGDFFAFDHAGIVPDIVTTAKSISGNGLPMALLFMKRELDVWEPGEHTGTFRGNQLAFITAKIALEYWQNEEFRQHLAENASALDGFARQATQLDAPVKLRWTGMLAGIDFGLGNLDAAARAQALCLDAGVLVERCGPNGEVVKLMPPINTPTDVLTEGFTAVLDVIPKAI